MDHGGIPMHNYFLLKALKNEFDCTLLSKNFFQNDGYSSSDFRIKGIEFPMIMNLATKINFPFLKNGVRLFTDSIISKLFEKNLKYTNGICEFMDIHSDGYSYLKNNPEKRKYTTIRSHTPFGLLRRYYNKQELRGVDTWYAFKREKTCFEWTGKITTPSNHLKNQLIDLYKLNPNKIIVLPNIIDTNHFRPLPKKKSKYFTILYVGRFERAKGVETLVKSFINLSKNIKNIRLINIGEYRGNSLEKCICWLKKGNLLSQVKFKGFLNYEDLPIQYAKADIVVSPSEIYESFSYTVAQGMACSKAVIASDIGGIPETLNFGNSGLLFPPGDVDSLSNQIEELYNDSEKIKALGEKARLFCKNNFSIELLKPRFMEYYQSLLK